MSQIIGLKLITGEEIIGEHVDTLNNGSTYKLKRVRALALMQNPQTGQPGMGLVPWTSLNMDQTSEISKNHVLTFIEPIDQIVQAYMTETSGIQIAKSI